jgi:hypothetical protein
VLSITTTTPAEVAARFDLREAAEVSLEGGPSDDETAGRVWIEANRRSLIMRLLISTAVISVRVKL